MAEASRDENIADAQGLSAMLSAVRDCPKPVIARVQGAAYGGGVGLVAACDLAYALPSARFALTEVRLGLIPAVIAPFLLGKMGPGAVRAWASRVPASTPPEPQIWGWCIRWLMKMDWTWPSTPRLTAFGVRPRALRLGKLCCNSFPVTLIQPR